MMRKMNTLFLALFLVLHSVAAMATIDAEMLAPLGGDDADARVAAVGKIAALANPEAEAVLQAINDEALYVTPSGTLLIVRDDKAFNPATGQSGAVPEGADGILVNNRLRGVVEAALSGFNLFSPDKNQRRAAAVDLQDTVDPAQLVLIKKAFDKEPDIEIRAMLQMLIARANLQSPDAGLRRTAVLDLAGSSNARLKPLLESMLNKNADGSYVETDPMVRVAVTATLRDIDNRLLRTEFVGNLFYGISLGSVLLLAALGLAITFGLMGIINMAHGELLMIGAYTTYVCQLLFARYLPWAIDAYLVAALPAAFIVTASVGVVLERTVIRWLYGRPLETLLATWGISLMLMQLVRTVFGAQNVEVANPSWMSGGVTVLGSLVLSYNRIVIIIFALLVVLAVWLILNKTRLGLFVRAVTQNRRMADCIGVSTARVDMMTFGLGSGIAGLGGVALSQLGNVGPDLGQGYIVDSFMVVVLGGVGQLAGTVIAALGLGEVNKFLEPVAGAVLAKIMILVFIIIFIQRRPQGLFAQKGRSVE